MPYPCIKEFIGTVTHSLDEDKHIKNELVGEIIRALGVASQKGLSKEKQLAAINYAIDVTEMNSSENTKIFI